MDFDAHYGVVIHQDFIPLYADDNYAKIFGYNNAQDILALKSILELIDPERQNEAAHTYYALMSGIEKPQVRSYINRNRLGELVNVLSIEHIVEWQGRPALQITIVDLTEASKLKRALVQNKQRYQKLVDGSVQGVLIHRNFTPLYCNDALARLFGYPNTQSIMALTSMLDIIEPSYQQRRIDANKALLTNNIKTHPTEIQCLHLNGNIIWVKIHEKVVDWEGLPALQVTVIDITESYLLKEKLDQQIHIDNLTQITNRCGMKHFAKKMLHDNAGDNEQLYCLLLCIDELKQINHLYGHDMGDKALMHFAQQCKNKLNDKDLFARWSSDEFIAITYIKNKNIVLKLAENIRHSAQDDDLIEPETGKYIQFSACVGITKWHKDDTLDSFILRADSALEQAKGQITTQLVMV